MNRLLYNIKDIFDNVNATGFLSNNHNSYNIPEYQRGYKWNIQSVEELLNDISNFEQINDKFYCLQNITIIPKANYYNVVDGQQRLTTLTILLAFLKQFDLVKEKLKYSVRDETNEFIQEMILTQPFWESKLNITNDIQSNWKALININKKYDKQDIFYLFSASYTIKKWFNKKDERHTKTFTDKLLNHVMLIVNEISDTSNEEKIFENLNSNRIPLDGADLVRAIIITRVAIEDAYRIEGNLKNVIRLNEHRVRIGWELDEINNFWNEKNVKTFFSAFTKISSDKDKIPVFDKDNYPINNLLYLIADIRLNETQNNDKKKFITFDIFEKGFDYNKKSNDDTLEMYQMIHKIHRTMQDWYNNKEIYHLLGFLFFHTGIEFHTIWEKWNKKETTRSEFINFLKEKIKTNLINEVTNEDKEENQTFLDVLIKQVADEKENWFNNNNLSKILILLDVVASLKDNTYKLPAEYFKNNQEDREHIFPQTPKELKEKEISEANELRKDYLEFLDKYSNISDKEKINEYLELIIKSNLTDDKIVEIDTFIKSINSKIPINSIGNLVLLKGSINRSYGNAPFSQKRAIIIKKIKENEFIRPHTLSVFSRNFITKKDAEKMKNDDMIFWNEEDIKKNAKNISEVLNRFFINNK